MFRLATALTTATLLALHNAPFAGAQPLTCPVGPNPFAGTTTWFKPTGNSQSADFGSSAIVHAKYTGRSYQQNAQKTSLTADTKVDTVNGGNTAMSHELPSAIPSNGIQLSTFTVVYTPRNGSTPGTLQLTVTHPGATSGDPVATYTVTSTNSGNALTKEPKVLGIEFDGAGNWNDNGNGPNNNAARTTILSLTINGTPYTSLPPPKEGGSNNGAEFKVYFDCPDNNPITIAGTAQFEWKNQGGSNDRPYLYFGFGEPAPCLENQQIITTGGTARCGCPSPLSLDTVQNSNKCVCPNGLLPIVGTTCVANPPAIRQCLTAPFFNNTHTNNAMTSQVDVNDNNNLPAKGRFTTSRYDSSGLVIGATAFTDGLETATFKWLDGEQPACKAVFTQTFGPLSRQWAASATKLAGVAVDRPGDAPYEEWVDLPDVEFVLTLDSQNLNECGFKPVTGTAGYITYENTLCGEFKYKECYSDAWGFVTVPTEVKTCYLVQVEIPKDITAVSSVKMVDRQKVDMRFSSMTNCSAGPVNGLWKTDLEFKTIVQYPYRIDSVTIVPVTVPAPAVNISAGNNTNCAIYTPFNLTTDGAVFDNLDQGNLTGNSYCRQDWYTGVYEAQVQTAQANCDETDVDTFRVIVVGACQPSIAGEHIACPDPNTPFSYETIVSVPRVCVRTITFELEDFDATLALYKTLTPEPQSAVVYTPGSQLCGVLSINPKANTPLDDNILDDFRIVKVEIFYTSTKPGVTPTMTMRTMSEPFLTPASQTLLLGPTFGLQGQAPDKSWVGRFCLRVDDLHVPGLQHTLTTDGLQDNPDKTTLTGTTNGISIFQRGYTVRVTAELKPGSTTRRLRTRVARITQEASKPGRAAAEAKFETLEMVPTESKTTTSGEGVKAVAPESSAVQAQSKQSGLADGAKIGIGVGVGIGALAALVIGAVVIMRRRAA